MNKCCNINAPDSNILFIDYPLLVETFNSKDNLPKQDHYGVCIYKKYLPTFHLRGSDMKLTVSGLKMINYCCTHHFVQDRKLRHSQFFLLIKSNGKVCLQFNFTSIS